MDYNQPDYFELDKKWMDHLANNLQGEISYKCCIDSTGKVWRKIELVYEERV